MKCRICNEEVLLFSEREVLLKYKVKYFRCSNCNFIQTEDPYWMAEAYGSAITKTDLGLANRNIESAQRTYNVICDAFSTEGRYLDYGGGYGLFVRIMRDKGFDFFRQDEYCENIFATYFDLGDLNEADRKFELLTAFEVFEHLIDPLAEVEIMRKYSDSIFFSTLLHDGNPDSNWWYWGSEHGQHISLFSYRSLEVLAAKYGLNLYSDGWATHLITSKKLPSDFLKYKRTFMQKVASRIVSYLSEKILNRDKVFKQSLTESDHDFVLKLLRNSRDKSR